MIAGILSNRLHYLHPPSPIDGHGERGPSFSAGKVWRRQMQLAKIAEMPDPLVGPINYDRNVRINARGITE